MISKQFTDEQMAVISTTAPRVFVSACAGSGKTSTLDARVRRLLDRGVSPSDILALCFSKTAVRVLKSRIDDGPRILTFHAFALELVRKAAGNGPARPVLLSPERSVVLLSETLLACPKACRSVHEQTGITLRSGIEPKRLAAFFKRCNGSDEVASRLVRDAESGFSDYVDVLAELRAVRVAYNKLVERAGGIDYPSMLRRAYSVIDDASLPYMHLLVDEAQDMDDAQTQLLVRLAKRIPSVMVFGDPNQAVFGFIGGKAHDMRNVLRDIVTLPLTRSFRLTEENAALANGILGNGKSRIVGTGHGVRPSLVRCASAIAQEDAVVSLVAKLKADGVAGDRIAILARTKAQLRVIEQALLSAAHSTHPAYRPNVPSHVTRVLNMLALVEACVQTARAGRKPKKAWRARCLREISGISARRDVVADCLRMLARTVRIPSFEGRYVMAMRIYLRLARTLGEPVSDIAMEIGRWQPIARKFKAASELRTYIAHLRQQSPVITSTIHNAKGGEWDHVVIVGVTDGSIPFYREIGRSEIDEERRLFYVAATRARKRLYLFHAPFHHAPSRQTFCEPSRFFGPAVLGTLGRDGRRMPAVIRAAGNPESANH